MTGSALPPAVMVHSLGQARLALAPARPVTLLSAPGAGMYAGCLWWSALLAAAGWTGPALLDCADAPGRALEALKLGATGIVLDCPPPAFAVVAGIAADQGAMLLAAAPPALDLAQRGAARRLAAWLG
jgi:hypothetical protein